MKRQNEALSGSTTHTEALSGARAVLEGATSERDFQEQVVAYAEAHQWTCWHDHDARRNDAGMPDLLLIRERVLWVELKRVGRKPTSVQAWFHDLLRRAGQEVYVWTPCDWQAIKQVLGGER